MQAAWLDVWLFVRSFESIVGYFTALWRWVVLTDGTMEDKVTSLIALLAQLTRKHD